MRKLIATVATITAVFTLLAMGATYYFFQWMAKPEVASIEEPPKEDYTTEQFIGMIGEISRDLAHEHNLYASVMIAQALLESNHGKSKLSAAPNHNLFGMKGHYNQASVVFKTNEDDGQGNLSTIEAQFRKYPNYEASLNDYVKLIKDGVSWDTNYYAPVHKSEAATHEEATAFLVGTYATDSRYDQKLNALIEQYDLTKYDQPVYSKYEVKVHANDTLNYIAEHYQVSLTSLLQWNQLQTSQLKEGQVLYIYK